MTLTEDRIDFAAARRAMIDSQLRVSGVNDPAILAAFAAVAREDFVPQTARSVAYIDRAVPLGGDAVLAPALTHGQMLTAAEPVAADRVLVIGAAPAYLAALATTITAHVTSATPGADMAAGAPYTLVLIDGAIEQVPDGLAALLADGARIVTGWIERGVARLAIGRRVAGELAFTTLAEADFAPIAAFAQPRRWSF